MKGSTVIDCNTGKVVSWSNGIMKNCYQSFEDYPEASAGRYPGSL